MTPSYNDSKLSRVCMKPFVITKIMKLVLLVIMTLNYSRHVTLSLFIIYCMYYDK